MNKEDLIKSLKNQKFPSKIINAFKKVSRENFVLEKYKSQSYEDIALPISERQTISQPYTIAFMLTLLELDSNKSQKIMEVGSGSGYVLALLSEICPKGKIFGIERIKILAEKSKKALKDYKNVKVIHKDGSKGLAKEKPFDRILVSAASEEIPQKLVNQLKFEGILVAPVKNSIVVVKKTSGENKIKEYLGFSFVPLIEE